MLGDIVLINDNPIVIDSEEKALNYSIFDVVIPILGKESIIEAESTAYADSLRILKENGLDLKDFENHCER